jgi:hypothetical protein
MRGASTTLFLGDGCRFESARHEVGRPSEFHVLRVKRGDDPVAVFEISLDARDRDLWLELAIDALSLWQSTPRQAQAVLAALASIGASRTEDPACASRPRADVQSSTASPESPAPVGGGAPSSAPDAHLEAAHEERVSGDEA